jgi:hypothetical protein
VMSPWWLNLITLFAKSPSNKRSLWFLNNNCIFAFWLIIALLIILEKSFFCTILILILLLLQFVIFHKNFILIPFVLIFFTCWNVLDFDGFIEWLEISGIFVLNHKVRVLLESNQYKVNSIVYYYK